MEGSGSKYLTTNKWGHSPLHLGAASQQPQARVTGLGRGLEPQTRPLSLSQRWATSGGFG